MRNKTPLALIEQAIMLLVFSLAAVLCLKAFAWADTQSVRDAARDQALLRAQSAAETLKHCRGDFSAAAEKGGGSWDGQVWTIRYDSQWKATDGEGEYVLRVTPGESGSEYLGLAGVGVFQGETRLAGLDVCWQEVDLHG